MKRVAIRIARPLTLIVALGLSLQAMPAASAPKWRPKAALQVVQTKTLVPEDAKTRHDRVEITMRSYSDGSVEVTGHGVAASSAADTTKEYTFDLAKGTYKVANRGAEAEASTARPASGGVTLSESDENTNAIAGAGHVRVHVMVVDPPQFVLAQNRNELSWNFNGATVAPAGLIEWCAASAPSRGNTNWKTLWCDNAPAWVWNAGTRVSNTARGVFENWDWLWDDLNTQSEIGSTITGRPDGRFDWGWTYRSSGESAAILQGKVILTT